MYKFLLQLEDNGHYSEDVAVVERLIREHNWLYQEVDPIQFESCHIKELSKEKSCVAFPVGSIEFVNQALKVGYDVGPMKPINVPPILFNEHFLGRRCTISKDKEELKSLYKKWNTTMLFVKSNSTIKAGYTDLYMVKENVPDDQEYFVSEPISIASEWRCFVYRGSLKDIKNYNGDPWLMPSRKFVNECIEKIGNEIIAYTLDVAVTSDNKSVVIEVHNFVSCGLYGFENPVIIPMLVNGIKKEIFKCQI